MSPLRKHLPVRAWIALLIAVTSPAPGTAGENLLFTGTLVTPPACTVSDKGGRINVDFATNIAIEKIDGDQYRQMIPYQIDCPGNDPSRGS